MKHYNKKILYALVVAYKNGIINRNPLKKWINKQYIYKKIIKYIVLIVSFIHVIIMINEGYVNIPEKTFLGNYAIDTYRLYNAILILPVIITMFKLYDYIHKIYYVNNLMRSYIYQEDDISALDKVTFKVKA